MTDTPDFDKMSPEEIMKWMESLAKRQGATEGMTTSADMDVGSVSEDDERLKGQGDYIPFGMKKEDWEKQKAKEEEQKRQRLAAQQSAPAPVKPVQAPPPPVQAPPPPPVQAAPPPPPAQPAAAVSDTPDFDKMSPEEIMKWMESLAVRQGVTEGLTTSADAQIADVAADDERLKGKGDYIPFGMKQADWEKQLAKEEEQKRQRAAQQPPAAAKPAASVQPPASSFQQPAASVQPAEIQPPDFLLGDLSLDIDEEETAVAGGANSPVDWLANIADDPDDTFSGTVIDNADDPFAALEQLSSGTSNDLDMSWLTDLGSTDNALDGLADLAAPSASAGNPLDFLADLAEPETPTPARPTASVPGPQPGEDSLEWLESMARDQGASSEELITPANLNVTRPKDTRPDGPGYTPYSFESASSTPEEPVPAESGLPDFLTEAEDASEDWLDEVARNVATDGHPAKTTRTPETPAARTPEPAKDEGVVDDVMARLSNAENVAPEDISRMFESLFERAEQYAHLDNPLDETPESASAEPDDIPDEALKAEIPDWLRDQMISSAPIEPSNDASKMDALMAMFDEETPAEPEAFTAQAAEPASEMPDWLRNTPDDDVPAVGVDLSSPVSDSDLPDWLQATEGETSDESIFAVQNSAMPWEMEEEDLGSIEDLPDLTEEAEEEEEPERAFELDTSDRWVEALTLEEEASDQLAQWYAEKTGEFSTDTMPDLDTVAPISQPTAAGRSVSLKHAQLPVEAVLMMGEPQAAPDWLLGSAAIPAAAAVAPSVTVTVEDDSDVPDWLREQTESVSTSSSDLDDIPEWLREQVDDTVASDANDLPPWLASEDLVTEAEGDDLPDWLRETMAEEEAAPVQNAAPVEHLAPTVVMTAPVLPPTPTPSPTAIQPVKSSPAPMVPVNIDVASTLQAARGKVSSGDINGSLADYELIVRANTALDDVVKDLSRLADHKDHKKNPAVYRVLGDTLMRRGDLKAALDTYRKALHML